MTQAMKSVCVGRFLIDVPVQSDVSFSNEMIDGLDIATVEESDAVFRARLAAHEAEISARDRMTDAHGPGGIEEARDLHLPGMVARLLVYGRTRSYSIEAGRRVDDEWISFEVHVHVTGLSFAFSAKYADPSDVERAVAMLARFRPRGEDEIPPVPGYCIQRGIFTEPLPPHKGEDIVMHLGIAGHPDMGMAFTSIPGGSGDQGLLKRFAVVDSEAGTDDMQRVTKLRSGKRNINGLEGEEEIDRVRESNFTSSYSYLWETPGVGNDPVHPKLSLAMVFGSNPSPGGRPVGSSFYEDAALALWSSISSTIRLRGITAQGNRQPRHAAGIPGRVPI